MRFYWTTEDVGELMGELEPLAADEFVSGHTATMRVHLRKIDTMKTVLRREQEWKLVEAEARRLQTWLDARRGTSAS